MGKNCQKILKEKLIRLNLSKKEIHLKILKSISQNNNIQTKTKIYTNYIINKINKIKNATVCRKNKVCLLTGHKHGLFKNINFSRHTIKKLILANRFTNIKNNSN